MGRLAAALTVSLSLPLRSALLLPARASRRRPPLTRLCATEARPQPSTTEQDFLVRNSRNDVQVLSCPNMAVLEQGLMELGSEPHICVAGESNAGKSSLINHLLVKKNLARASSRAGKTTAVDLMLVNQQLVVADLPGLPSRDHQVSEMWQRSWSPLVMEYIRRCDSLRVRSSGPVSTRERQHRRNGCSRASDSARTQAMVYVHDVRWKVSAQCRDFVADVQVMHP